jgi:uncharacterized membrane protein
MGFIAFVLIIVAWIYFSNRIGTLEEKITHFENHAHPNEKPTPTESLLPIPENNPPKQTEQMYPNADYSPMPYSSQPSALENFFAWCKEDLMVKIGAFLLILAFGWFVSYAVVEQWIGPVGQISLGLLSGLLFLCLGVWRIGTHAHQGGIFTVLGSTIVLLVLFAAREVYGLFTPATALFVMFLSVAFVAYVGVHYNRERLAYSGLLLASVAPLLSGIHMVSAVDLFTYLLVITAGSLWVVWVTGWTRIILMSVVVTYLYSIFFLMDGYGVDKDVVLMFSFVFVAIYFVSNLVSLLRRKTEIQKHIPAHVATAVFTAVFLFSWVEFALAPEWKGLMYVSWALVFALGTYFIYLYTANQTAFYLYGATSVTLIGVATAAELDGPVLTLAYFLEVCLIIFAASRIKVKAKTLANLSLLMILPASLALSSLNMYHWRDGLFQDHFVIVCIAAVTLFAVGMLLQQKKSGEDEQYVSGVSMALLIGSIGYALSLIWLSMHALFSSDFATMMSLFIYTVIGITSFVTGTIYGQKSVKIFGAILIGFVVTRLLLIEVWDMELGGRIITFLVVGVMLMSTAFIKKIHPVTDASNIDSR